MKDIGKGLLVILMTIALFGLSMKAKADTEAQYEQVMEGVMKVYPQGGGMGSCWFGQDGVLTFKAEVRKATYPCIVGMKLPDTTKHYVVLGDENGPAIALLFDEATKTQTVIWRRDTSKKEV